MTPDTQSATTSQAPVSAPDVVAAPISTSSRFQDALVFGSIRDIAGTAASATKDATKTALYHVSGQAHYDRQTAGLYADPSHQLTPEQLRGMRAKLNRDPNRTIGIDMLSLQGAGASGAAAVNAMARSGKSVDMTEEQIRAMAKNIANSGENIARVVDDREKGAGVGTVVRAGAAGVAAGGVGAIAGGAGGVLLGVVVKPVAWLADKVFGTKINQTLSFKRLASGGALALGGYLATKSAGGIISRKSERATSYNVASETAHELAVEQGIRNAIAAHGGHVTGTAKAPQTAAAPKAPDTTGVAPPSPPDVTTGQAPPPPAKVTAEPAAKTDAKPADVAALPETQKAPDKSPDTIETPALLQAKLAGFSGADLKTQQATIDAAVKAAELQNAKFDVSPAHHDDIGKPKTPESAKVPVNSIN